MNSLSVRFRSVGLQTPDNTGAGIGDSGNEITLSLDSYDRERSTYKEERGIHRMPLSFEL